jgi:hypothetical protein
LYAPSTLSGASATAAAANAAVDTAVHRFRAPDAARPGFAESRTRSWIVVEPVTTAASNGTEGSSSSSVPPNATISEKSDSAGELSMARHVAAARADAPETSSCLSSRASSSETPKNGTPSSTHEPGVPVFVSMTSVGDHRLERAEV